MALTKTQEAIPFVATLLWFTLLWFGVIAVNVNQQLGLIYLAVFTLGSMFLYFTDIVKTTPLDRTGKWGFAIIQGIGLYAIFVILATVLSSTFAKVPLSNVWQLLLVSAPALAASRILNTITFVGPVAFIETIFLIMSLDFLASFFHIDISRNGMFKPKTLLLVASLVFAMVVFHITAKGISNNLALMLVALMFFITLMSAIYFGEAKQACIFHVIANSAGMGLFGASLLTLSLLFSPILTKFKLKQ